MCLDGLAILAFRPLLVHIAVPIEECDMSQKKKTIDLSAKQGEMLAPKYEKGSSNILKD